MTYSEQTTSNHPLAHRYQKLIDTVLKNEGARNTPFTTEKCIDLDQLEIDLSRGQDRDKTMDFMIGLTSKQMLLVEAKLNVKSPNNLGKKELEEKIRHTKEILIEREVSIAKEKVFLFDDHVIGKARYYISQLFQKNPNVKIYTVKEFKEIVFL